MRDPMLDEEFLKQLVEYPHKFVWAKIISFINQYYNIYQLIIVRGWI